MKKNFVILMALLVTSLGFIMCSEDDETPKPDDVSNLVISPATPGPDDDVTVSADVTSVVELVKVQLVYSISGTETTVDMNASGDRYSATIPKQVNNTVVDYYIFVENNTGATIFYPETAPESTLSYTVVEPEVVKIVINEFCCSNDVLDVDGTGNFPDWIELYNAGNVTVDFGGWYITDDLTHAAEFQMPTGNSETIIEPGEFLLLFADKEHETLGGLHIGIKLSGSGESIGITSDTTATYMDSFSYGDEDGATVLAPETDNSAGLTVDGGDTWIEFVTADVTPGTTNVK